jgi:hypothetical protein
MLTKVSVKIDKFYALLTVLGIVLAIYVGIVFREIFHSISIANEIDNEVLEAPSPHLNRESLNNVYRQTIEEETTPLDL